jgi:hypothetical protein
MQTAKEIFESTFERIKRMQMYTITREVGPGWLPKGTIPFNTRCKNGIATFEVYAEFLLDAEDQVTAWLERTERDEPDE